MSTPGYFSLFFLHRGVALVAAGLVMFGSSQVQAGASNKNGNPFSQNGTFFNNSGTYTAIMRGQNLMGVSQFSIFADGLYPSSGWNMLNGGSSNTVQPGQTNPGSGTPGFVSLYYNGSSYNGPAFSVLDPGGNQIGSVFYTYKAGGSRWDPAQGNLVTQKIVTNAIVTNQTNTIINVTYSTNADYSYSYITNFSNSYIYITNNSSAPITNYTYTYNYITNQSTATITNGYVSTTNISTNYITNGSGDITTNVLVNISSNPNITTTNLYDVTVQTISNPVISYTPLVTVVTNSNPIVLTITNTNPTITAFTNTNPTVVSYTNYVASNVLVTNSTNANGGYNYYEGYWNASLQNKYPNQVFYGNGVVSLGQSGDPTDPSPINQANGTTNVRQIPFSVQGTRVSGSTSQIY
jgi:hypothetical protein